MVTTCRHQVNTELVEREILEIVRVMDEISIPELTDKIQQEHPDYIYRLQSALLYLLSCGDLILTLNRKLKMG